jgi:hypothetical protein
VALDEIIERYEHKYLVPEHLVPAVREAALATCKIDRYAGPDGTYRIRSLYFDTPRFDLFAANEREQADRFKMRARCYPAATGAPVFLEVKRRVLDVIVKTRAGVPPGLWLDVIAGRTAALDALSPQVQKAAMRFLAPYHRHHLVPTMLVEYEREAYVSEVDVYARLTFDRNILVQARRELDLEADPGRFRAVDHGARSRTGEPVCVLELKFERRPPAWMSALVRRLGLVRHSFSKYCYGVAEELTLPAARVAFGR